MINTTDPIRASEIDKNIVCLKQDKNDLYFKVHNVNDENTENVDPNIPEKIRKRIFDYFYLDVSLTGLYEEWANMDNHFKKKALPLKGIRMLRIDPVENLFCFICSSNNNIPRITQMVDKMSREFGEYVGELDGQDFFTFPKVKSLVGSENRLRELGFGYRAKYIDKSAQALLELAKSNNLSPETFLIKLRKSSYEEAHLQLVSLQGIGPKVADCICLMSLDKYQAIPVDTHVRAIAERDYGLKVPGKTLTPTGYQKIVELFQKKFGQYSGWAHSVLFAADLRWLEFEKPDTPGDSTKKAPKRAKISSE